MNRPEHDSLLQHILAEDDLADFRQASLEAGLVSIRSRHRRLRAIRTFALASLPLVLALAIFLRRPPASATSGNPPAIAIAAVSAPAPVRSDVKFISDEELFALFPRRPMALIGKPGQQQLVFLDHHSAARRQ